VLDELVDERGFNPMIAVAAIKGLFDQGFLCELDVIAPGRGVAHGTLLQLATS
jgi:hypothetical protein